MSCRNLVIAFVALWLIAGPRVWALDQKTTKSRLDQIKNMTPIERDRVDRNAEAFRAMSPEQRHHYRELHEKLAEDRRNGGGLSDLLDAYTQWLSTLTPVQRDQLQAEKEPGKKQILVRQMIEDRERQQREAVEAHTKESKERTATSEDAANSESSHARPSIFPNLIRLEKKDLEAIVRAVADDLPADQRPADLEKLSVFQYPSVIEKSIASKRNTDEWPDDDLLKKMEQSLQGLKIGTVFHELGQLGSRGKEIAATVVLREIVLKAYASVNKPTENDRKQAYENLRPGEKKRYDGLKSEKGQRDFLNDRFLEQADDVSYSQFKDCGNNILGLFDQLKIVPPQPMVLMLKRPNKRTRFKP